MSNWGQREAVRQEKCLLLYNMKKQSTGFGILSNTLTSGRYMKGLLSFLLDNMVTWSVSKKNGEWHSPSSSSWQTTETIHFYIMPVFSGFQQFLSALHGFSGLMAQLRTRTFALFSNRHSSFECKFRLTYNFGLKIKLGTELILNLGTLANR